MSTYEQSIASLRENNWRSLNQIKTYNLDVAKFQSANFQRQGELLLLAGKLGGNIVEKIQAKREKDAINEVLISEYEQQWEAYEKSDAAKDAETRFNAFTDNQNLYYEKLRKLEEDGVPSSDIAEGKMSTGKAAKLKESLYLANLQERFPGWVNNQLLNDENIFFAEIDGVPQKIQVNDRNLGYKQEIAVRKHLTREYLNLHNIQKYSRDFLYLPKERGGSGFMKGLLEANNAAFQDLENKHKVQLSENEIALATANFSTSKTPESFKALFYNLSSGYDAKGKLLGYAGAWKRMNDKILQPMVEAGLLPPDQVLELGKNTTLTLADGRKVTLDKYRPLEWGENGKWYRESMKTWKKKGEWVKEKFDFKFEQASEKAINLIESGEMTSKTDMRNVRIELAKLDAKGSGTGDFTKIDEYIESAYTKETADDRARQILNDWLTNPTGKRLQTLIETEDIRIRNSPVLTRALKEDKRIWDIVDDGINQMRTNYYNHQKVQGQDVWTIKSANHYRKWEAIEGYAVRYFKQNQDKNIGVADVLEATQKWEKSLGDEEVIGTPYELWDAREAKLTTAAAGGDKNAQTQLEEFQRKKKLHFVQDSEGFYPNLTPQPTNIEVSKEDQKELLHLSDSAKFLKINTEAKFTNPNTIIPEEQAVFKDADIDYNKLLDDIGYIDDSIVDIAASNGLTTAEFIKYRQKANGKKDLKPEYSRFLNEIEVSTLPSAMKARLLGNVNDGQYTPENIPATIARNSFLAGAPVVMSFGTNGEDYVHAIGASYKEFANSIDDEGDFTFDGDSGKTLFGLYAGIGMSLNPKVFNDFQTGGANLFVETVKENLSEESITSMVTDPKFGFDAYSAGGIIEFLPVVDMLQESKGRENLQKILDKILKYQQQNLGEDSSIID